jgi:predicted nucleic acid-binding protein
MTKVLIDTDVILDFFFDRKPFSDRAAEVLAMCESGKIMGYVTPVILSNTYYLLRKTAKHRNVVEKLKQLVSIVDILVIDRNVILNALNSDFTDFEDALQNYSAEMNGEIDIVITRNIKDFKSSSLGVMTPENCLKFIRSTL